jgi:uncharacterized membrane protein
VKTRAALWALIVLYAAARVLQIFSGVPPGLGVVALHVVPPLAFALLHGAAVYGARGILAFTAICLAVGNAAENIGVVTGFPFGRYYFTGVMGPKLFYVPVLLGLAYIGMGYVSWTLARLIVGPKRHRILLPLTAAAVMTTWDLSLDPVWSTILHAWIWTGGGAWFGVPLTNFAGWLLTTYLIYQWFAFVAPHPRAFDGRTPVAFYAVSALGNLLLLIPLRRLPAVADPAGRVWQVSGICAATIALSLLMLGICAAAHAKSR